MKHQRDDKNDGNIKAARAKLAGPLFRYMDYKSPARKKLLESKVTSFLAPCSIPLFDLGDKRFLCEILGVICSYAGLPDTEKLYNAMVTE